MVLLPTLRYVFLNVVNNAKAEINQPYTTYFLRADIHELITPDLLHQLIKGVFKDHLVDWVAKYLEYHHGTADMERVLDEIDRRLVAHPLFITYVHRLLESHLRPRSLASVDSNRGGISVSGPGTILRL